MKTCMDCLHWSPKDTDPAMARRGFSICKRRGESWRFRSAHAPACEKFSPADDDIAAARHKHWDTKP